MDNYNRSIIEYLRTYPNFDALFFNTATEGQGNTSVNTMYGTTWVKKYVRGHGVKAYDFAIIYYGLQDEGTSEINIQEMEFLRDFMDWIDEQNEKKNFPVFSGAKVLSIENLQNEPNVAGVNEAGTMAKYMAQIRVLYTI